MNHFGYERDGRRETLTLQPSSSATYVAVFINDKLAEITCGEHPVRDESIRQNLCDAFAATSRVRSNIMVHRDV